MTKKIKFSAAIFLSLVLPATAALAKPVEILFNNFLPPLHILSTDAWPEWAKRVEQATEGRVKIKFPPSSLAPPPRQWEAVTQGLADGAFIFHGFAENRVTLPQVAQLPWLASESGEATSVALWRTHEKFRDRAEYKDVVLIGMFAGPGGEFYSLSEKPLSSVAQLQSIRTWAVTGATADILKSVGAPVETSPTVRGHEFVSNGMVDAFVGSTYYDSENFRMLSYAKAVTEFSPKISVSTFSVFLSKSVWQRISEADRTAIMAVSGEELARLHGRTWDQANRAARQRLIEAGIQLHEPPQEFVLALHQAGHPIIEKWLRTMESKKMDGEAVLEYYKKALRDAEEELSKP